VSAAFIKYDLVSASLVSQHFSTFRTTPVSLNGIYNFLCDATSNLGYKALNCAMIRE
jgi:hypothetical protein